MTQITPQPSINQEAWRYADPAALSTYKVAEEPAVERIAEDSLYLEVLGGGTVATAFAVQPGACLTHIRMAPPDLMQPAFANTQVWVDAGARVRTIFVNFAPTYVRNEVHVELQAKGAHADLLGAYMLSGKGHSDTLTRVHHAAADTTSDEVYKGVLAGQARGVFQAQIRVAPDAQRIVGNQMHRALMLSDDARVDAKPELEIFADDVQCSHGATVGDLDPQQLFYLTARGIPQQTARALLIRAFLADVLADLPEAQHQAAQAYLDTYLAEL